MVSTVEIAYYISTGSNYKIIQCFPVKVLNYMVWLNSTIMLFGKYHNFMINKDSNISCLKYVSPFSPPYMNILFRYCVSQLFIVIRLWRTKIITTPLKWDCSNNKTLRPTFPVHYIHVTSPIAQVLVVG